MSWKNLDEVYPKKNIYIVVCYYDTKSHTSPDPWEVNVINEKYLDSVDSPYIYWDHLPRLDDV